MVKMKILMDMMQLLRRRRRVMESRCIFKKNGRCLALDKTTEGAIKFLPRPKLACVHGNGLYLPHGGDIYHGEDLLFGKSSPFLNIPVLGWHL